MSRSFPVALALLILGACALPMPGTAQEIDPAHLQQVRQCGGEFFGHPPAEGIAAFQKKHMGPEYKKTLMAAMSPYAPIQGSWTGIDPETAHGIGALIAANATEMMRGYHLVDPTPADALHLVLLYYMAMAAGGDCSPPADARAWVEGLAYGKLGRKADVMAIPFAQLDVQQTDIDACAWRERGQKDADYPAISRWILANGKADALVAAAHDALAGSAHMAELDGWGKMPETEYSRYGISDRDEARVFNAFSTLYVDSKDDPDYGRRLKSRLLFVYYESLASGGSCTIPAESLQVIESLHATHQ
jgi:hypothetical protein